MDFYMEHMLKKQKDGKDIAIITAVIILGVLVTGVLFMLMFAAAIALSGTQISQFSFSIGLVLIAFVWYGVYLAITSRNIEYEYILTNSEVDMDRIMSRRGRKRLASFDFAEAEIVANIDDNEHNFKYKNPETGLKIIDVTGDKARGGVYFADYFDSETNERKRVLFQPTSKMIEAIRKANPRNVFIYEE